APMPTPDPGRIEVKTFYPGISHVRVRHQPSMIYGAMGNEQIEVTNTPTLIETIFIPVTDSQATVGINWRANTMYIGSCPSYDNILPEASFESPKGNQSLDPFDYLVVTPPTGPGPGIDTTACDLGTHISSTTDTVFTYGSVKSATLTVVDSNATGGLTYKWLDDSTAGHPRTVAPSTQTTYTVVTEDAKGCTDTASYTIEVDNIQCGPNHKLLCLHPTGWFNFTATICLPASISTWASNTLSFASLGNCVDLGYLKTAPAGPIDDDVLDAPPFKLFPVPSRGPVTFASMLILSEKLDLQVTDMQGRIVYLEQMDVLPGSFETQLDFSDLSPGTYVFQFTDGQQTQSKKFTLH
ncbi:MAG: T9SS type A sorting domain-containing protein, partial [Bacteroidota bacterium]